MTDACLALDRVVDLVGSSVGVESKGQFDSPALAPYLPVEEGQVFFVYQAFCKLLREDSVAGAVSGEKHNTGGGHIKAMHGSLGNIVMKEGGYASGYAVLFLGPSSWDGEQSPRFVDYQEIWVFMEYDKCVHGRP